MAHPRLRVGALVSKRMFAYSRNAAAWSPLAAALEVAMAQTYKPGEAVPRDGVVECTEYPGTRDRVKAGTRFAPCDHWGDHHPQGCTWQYVD